VTRTICAASSLRLPSDWQENEQTEDRSNGLGIMLERYHSGEPSEGLENFDLLSRERLECGARLGLINIQI
jgi:hypothetical protein